MTLLITTIIGIIAIVLGYWLGRRGRQWYNERADTETDPMGPEELIGQQKEDRKLDILNLLKEKGELANKDIRVELGLPERTVVRYMDELETENKVEQVGEVGRSVIYRLK